MSEAMPDGPMVIALRALERALEAAHRERDEFRDLWLKQVDINDKIRAERNYNARRIEELEGAGHVGASREYGAELPLCEDCHERPRERGLTVCRPCWEAGAELQRKAEHYGDPYAG